MFDTSGIISLADFDAQRVAKFFRDNRDRCIITDGVMEEVKINNQRMRNARRKVVPDTVFEAVSAAYLANDTTTATVQEHSDYDLHRWLGLKMAYQSSNKKKTDNDEISGVDTHILATGLTLGANIDHFRAQHEFSPDTNLVVIVSTDEHVTGTLGALKNSIYGPAYPGQELKNGITPDAETVSGHIGTYANVRAPNLYTILQR
ncbi:hypothetical protein GOV07_04785 [Candidatus Woesearchaeota archaeon]|nr:hypothetical protein [Candidatus Woesearchaeota archaeon]